MLILARLMGVVVVAIGTIIMLNPDRFKAILNFWRQGKKIYMAGIARLVFGVIFLLIAQECKKPPVISVLGVLMILGGIFIFAMGPERIKVVFNWWEKRPPSILRLMGFIALAMGALILYSI